MGVHQQNSFQRAEATLASSHGGRAPQPDLAGHPGPKLPRLDALRPAGSPFAVVLRAETGGASLAREPVTSADLADVVSEVWRDGCLRKGHPQAPLNEVPISLRPLVSEALARCCVGFELEVTNPGGSRHRQRFGVQSLGHVGRRAAQRLIEAGTLKLGQPCYYDLTFNEPADPAAWPPDGEAPFRGQLRSPALVYLDLPLRPLLERAQAVDLSEDDVFPVFYTADAMANAERFARKGAETVPPVETGAVLLGSLCSCRDTGEFFCVVTDVLEVLEAEHSEFQLSYTSQSWTRIQAIIKARQVARPARAERILGQCHGHNFLPNEGRPCEACARRPVCSLTNLFVSLDDANWSRAVFAHQPWQLCHIFGLSARGDKVNCLYGLQDGRLQPRGFFTIPDFNPEQFQRQP